VRVIGDLFDGSTEMAEVARCGPEVYVAERVQANRSPSGRRF
jgi:hypothetical protein